MQIFSFHYPPLISSRFTKHVSPVMIVNDLWIRPYVTMLQMMKFFANYVMAKISDPKDMVMVEVVCPHYWLVSLVNLLMIVYSEL